ncbi:hypothetical protein ALO86_200083 [Pseudomonas syringae pv. berberidis]|nr:hypothetical protein ALO86_200083 [Pseudomonas syringae pv. berberidis]
MGQAVGLLVERAIRQALFAVDYCQRFRRALGLCFEQAMNGLFVRVIQLGIVEPHQQLLALGSRQDRQAVEGSVRRLFQRNEQVFQRGLHIPANPPCTDLAGYQH